MAGSESTHSPLDAARTDTETNPYRSCVITPMSRSDDEPLVRIEHLIDALIVSVVVFCSVLLGDVAVALAAGQSAYVTPAELLARAPTGVVAFVLTFAAQWGRARGLELKAILLGTDARQSTRSKDPDDE
jgi:hypothetical protein